MEYNIDVNSLTDEEFINAANEWLEAQESKREKIVFLNFFLRQAMRRKRDYISRFIIKKMEEIRAKKKYVAIGRMLESEDYLNKSFEEKAKYWSGRLHGQMRNQVEWCLDEYSIFTPEWYAAVKRHEPDFDSIMDYVFENFWANYWDKKEYLKRISPRYP
jgi:hypothetical protein